LGGRMLIILIYLIILPLLIIYVLGSIAAIIVYFSIDYRVRRDVNNYSFFTLLLLMLFSWYGVIVLICVESEYLFYDQFKDEEKK
jgi:hypothetical protein